MTEVVGDLKRTPLDAVHERLGARLVPFAGYRMPVSYDSILEEHRAVRERVGVFDVSHMGELVLTGPRAIEAVQRVTTNDASALAVDQAQYSAMCLEDGGILDDCVVYRTAGDEYMIVVNASNVEKDREHVRTRLPGDGVELEDRSEATALLAVQGPRALEVVASLADVEVEDIPFYWKRDGRIAGLRAVISRTGYTGEDGFELYAAADDAEPLWEALMTAGEALGIRPCGLGARDTLRLEMKYALYGSDIDESTNPYEAGLGWIVKLDKGDFTGGDALRRIKEDGPSRTLVGFRMAGRGIPRPGYGVLQEGEKVADVRSGTSSPTLGYGIGTFYAPRERSRPGTPLGVDIRGTVHEAEIVKTPFYTEGSLKR
ncbi:MAG TPA: glycine cleavage system aminomethyltransferase GcvT [Gemmatimonadota bacterium]|nr:glycine cleavage system aminomethyltransferase GcvT [Gemmatimonadota bacterium]